MNKVGKKEFRLLHEHIVNPGGKNDIFEVLTDGESFEDLAEYDKVTQNLEFAYDP